MALLLAEQIDATGESAPHKLLTMSGVRKPWMPSPLQGSADRIVRSAITIVVGASIALPGAIVWMPRPIDSGVVAPQERTYPPLIQVNQPPIPQASVVWLRSIKDEAPPPPARFAPTTIIVNQPLWHAGNCWLPTSTRTDPERLAPPILQTNSPPWPSAITLLTRGARLIDPDVLRQTLIIVHPARPTDANALFSPRLRDTPERLAPTITQVTHPPQPGALLTLLAGATRIEADAVRPLLTLLGATYQTPAQTIWLGSPKDTPDRLAPTTISVGATYTTAAQALFSPRLRDTPERLASPILQTNSPPWPGATSVWLLGGRAIDPDVLRQTLIIIHAAYQTPAQALWLRSPFDTPERLASLSIISQRPPQNDAITVWMRSLRDEFVVMQDRLAPTAIIGTSPPQPGASTVWLRSLKDQVVIVDRLAPTMIRVGDQYYQRAILWLPTSTRTDPERLAPPILQTNSPPWPGATSVWLLGGRAIDPDVLRQTLIIIHPAAFTPAQMTWLTSAKTDPDRLARLAIIVGNYYPTAAQLWYAPNRFSILVDLFPTEFGTLFSPGMNANILSPDADANILSPDADANILSPDADANILSSESSGIIEG